MNSYIEKLLENIDGVLISSYANIVYLTGYAGFSNTERECFLLITKNKQYLITDKRYSQALNKLKDFEIIDTGVMNFLARDHSNILKNLRMNRIGIEENNLSVSEYKCLKKKLKKTVNIDLSKLRTIKNADEIKNIKLACKIGDEAYEFILDKLKNGISEKQIIDKLELFIKQKGGDTSFKPIVAFGKNSSVPHHLSGKSKLKKNQIVLLDFGVKINNYCSDMSRTFFFGKAPDKFRKIYQTVFEAQAKGIEFINSSILNHKSLMACDIDKIARKHIVSNGYPTIPHSIGHGIGIEVHEAPHISPNSKEKIKTGMVFSIEPGIYLSDYGGIRIEDLVLVTKNGAKLISHANREIIEI